MPGGEGLAFFNSRWYDAQVGLFTPHLRTPQVGAGVSADTIVPNPGDPQSLNRYAYVGGNPLKFSDPSGHAQVCDDGGSGCVGSRRVVTPSVQRYRAWSYAWAQASQAAARAANRPRLPTVYNLPRSLLFRPPTTPAPTRRPAVAIGPTVRPAYRAAATLTPTPGTFLGARSGPTALPVCTPPPDSQPETGQVNWQALSWSTVYGMMYEVPGKMMEKGLAPKYLAKGGLKSIPIVGVLMDAGLSAGPNLAQHWRSGDTLRETGIDLAVDLGGVAASQVGGAAVGMYAGAQVTARSKSIQAGAVTAVGVSYISQLIISPFWDLAIGPQVIKPWLESVVP